MSEHVKVFEDESSVLFDIVDDDGLVIGQTQQFKVDADGEIPAPTPEGEALQAERAEAVVARQEEAQAALAAENAPEEPASDEEVSDEPVSEDEG